MGEPTKAATPEPPRDPTPEPVKTATPEPFRESTPEPVKNATPEPVREQTPEPPKEATPEPVKVLTPEPAPVHLPVKEASPDVIKEEELVEVIGSISKNDPDVKESTSEPKDIMNEENPEVETNKEELSRLAEEIIADDKEPIKEKSPSIEAISPEPMEVKANGNTNENTNGNTEDDHEDQGAKGLKDFMEKTIPDTDKIENGFTHITEDDVEIIGAVEDESKLE